MTTDMPPAIAPLPPKVAAVLDLAARDALDSLCRASAEMNAPLYLVGGVVRDCLLLPAPPQPGLPDIDLAVEGDSAALAAALRGPIAGQVVGHDRFGTAVIRGAARIDIARTRRDRYPHPAALPEVSDAGIEDDLARRDFTVNAAAHALTGPSAGQLLDPFDGASDARRGLIRVLHDAAFQDDPTRIIRACRYAARLDAKLEPGTRRLAVRDRRHLAALSPARFGDAWRLLLADPAGPAALEFARALRVPQSRVQGWEIARPVLKAASAAAPERRIEAFWAAVGLTARRAILDRVETAVGLNARERRALRHGCELRALRNSLGQWRRASSAAAALERIPDIALQAASEIWSGPSAERIADIHARRDEIAPPLDGGQIAALGVPRGPEIGAWLARLKAARWDGELPRDPAAARIYAEQWVRSGTRPPFDGAAP